VATNEFASSGIKKKHDISPFKHVYYGDHPWNQQILLHKKIQSKIQSWIYGHTYGIMCCYLFLLQFLACHVDDQIFQPSKLIMCNGHATALALVISFILSFTYGFAFRLKMISSSMSSFAFATLIVRRFMKT
jgi:hypothetical protein